MADAKRILVSQKKTKQNKTKQSHVTKMWKTTFTKEFFFNQILLKVEEHDTYTL